MFLPNIYASSVFGVSEKNGFLYCVHLVTPVSVEDVVYLHPFLKQKKQNQKECLFQSFSAPYLHQNFPKTRGINNVKWSHPAHRNTTEEFSGRRVGKSLYDPLLVFIYFLIYFTVHYQQ